jgi:hypothetical protein
MYAVYRWGTIQALVDPDGCAMNERTETAPAKRTLGLIDTNSEVPMEE